MHRLFQLGSIGHPFELSHMFEKGANLHLSIHTAFFREVSDSIFGLDGGLLSENAELSGVWEEDRHDHADGRGLPCTVWTNEPVESALGDIEVDSFDGDFGSEGFTDALHLDCVAQIRNPCDWNDRDQFKTLCSWYTLVPKQDEDVSAMNGKDRSRSRTNTGRDHSFSL